MNPQELPSNWQEALRGQLVIRRLVAPKLIQLAWGCMVASVGFMLVLGPHLSFFSLLFWLFVWAPVFLAGLFLVKTDSRVMTVDTMVGSLEVFSDYGLPLLFRLSEITGVVPVRWDVGNAPLRFTLWSVAIQVQDGSLLRLPFLTMDQACAEAWAYHLANATSRPLQESCQVIGPQVLERDKLSSLVKVGN